MLLDSAAVHAIMESLFAEDFFRDVHRTVFQSAHSLYSRGEAVDLVTLSGELRRQQRFEEIGGWGYLNELSQTVPTVANLGLYIHQVREAAILRNLIAATHRISNTAFLAAESSEDILNTAEKAIMDVGARGGMIKTYASIGDVLSVTYENLGKQMADKGSTTGIASGFIDFDRLTSGLQRSDLIIVAARPGVGKSTLLLNIARHAAIAQGVPTAFFSLEMSGEQLAQRLLCSEADVDLHSLRSGYLDDRDWGMITRAIGPLAAAPIYIDDAAALSVVDLRSRARRMKTELGLGLIVVDYLQLMTLGSRSESRQQEISFISRSLKALAKELDLPVIAASQLSRAVEARQDKRPMLSDLLESGGIEANADLVIFLYRDDYYNPQSDRPNTAELILAKQRNGPTGTVELFFLKQYNKFANKVK